MIKGVDIVMMCDEKNNDQEFLKKKILDIEMQAGETGFLIPVFLQPR